MNFRKLLPGIFLVIMTATMVWQGRSLVTPVSPRGILDLEFAGTVHRLQQLRLFLYESDVLTNLYLDFLYIVVYTYFFRSIINQQFRKSLKSANRSSLLRQNVVSLILKCTLLAAVFDVAENILLHRIYTGAMAATMIKVVYWCALFKFAIVLLIILFIALNWILNRPMLSKPAGKEAP